MYYLLGACLAFTVLLAVNSLASVAAAGLWRVIERPARRWWSCAARARVLFWLRSAPAAASLICVVVLLLPAYVAHEPQHSTETVSAKLALLALLSVSGIALALWRGLATWRATRRLISDWMLHAEPISIDGVTVPTYKLSHSFPVISVVGALRPRLFIAAKLFDALEPEELAAAVLHEKGHLLARDNFKRPLVRACCDVLAIVPSGRVLERAWAEEAEAAADEYAARSGGDAYALSLASALIKIARLVPSGLKPTMPAGAFLFGEAGAPLANRVRRLAQFAGEGSQHPVVDRSAHRLTMPLLLCCFFALLCVVVVTQTQTLATIHGAIERFVAALQ